MGRIKGSGHLPFPGFFYHHPVEETGEQELADNRLHSAAPYPQLAHRLLRHAVQRLGGHFRLEYRRHRAHGIRKLVARPLKLRRIQPRHLHHHQLHAAALVHQLGTQRIRKAADRRLGPAVGRLQRNGAIGQRRSHLNNHPAIPGRHQRQRGASAVDAAKIGDVRHPAKLVVGQRVKRCQHRAHRIVDPHIDLPQLLGQGACRLGQCPAIRHVDAHCLAVDAVLQHLRPRLFKAIVIARNQPHVITRRRKPQRRGFADSRRRAGNHHYTHRASPQCSCFFHCGMRRITSVRA
ncbi:hypothetical protein D3C75_826140 [compost metagenome]